MNKDVHILIAKFLSMLFKNLDDLTQTSLTLSPITSTCILYVLVI